MAALKGIDLDEGQKQQSNDLFDKVKQRADAKIHGISEGEVERRTDADMFGLEFEVEE